MTWQAMESMKPGFEGGMTSRVVVGETGKNQYTSSPHRNLFSWVFLRDSEMFRPGILCERCARARRQARAALPVSRLRKCKHRGKMLRFTSSLGTALSICHIVFIARSCLTDCRWQPHGGVCGRADRRSRADFKSFPLMDRLCGCVHNVWQWHEGDHLPCQTDFFREGM